MKIKDVLWLWFSHEELRNKIKAFWMIIYNIAISLVRLRCRSNGTSKLAQPLNQPLNPTQKFLRWSLKAFIYMQTAFKPIYMVYIFGTLTVLFVCWLCLFVCLSVVRLACTVWVVWIALFIYFVHGWTKYTFPYSCRCFPRCATYKNVIHMIPSDVSSKADSSSP